MKKNKILSIRTKLIFGLGIIDIIFIAQGIISFVFTKKSVGMSIGLIAVCIVLTTIIGLIMAWYVISKINKCNEYLKHISEGDISKDLKLNANDEFSVLETNMNAAVTNVRELVEELNNSIIDASKSAEELSSSTEEINAQVESVTSSTQQIATGMQDTSASVQEISASSSDIGSLVKNINEKAQDEKTSSEEIIKRAEEVSKIAHDAMNTTNALYDEKQAKVLKAIEDGRVVDEIKNMAEAISDIASQTNMLALNAAIEAARAGEHGKGFAVVAEEVRKLAEESADSVSKIENVIGKVQSAFTNLSNDAGDILKFIDENVKKDYAGYERTGQQYKKDAELIGNTSASIADAIEKIGVSIDGVNKSLENVSATVEETSSGSEEISGNVSEVSSAVDSMAKLAEGQKDMSSKLSGIISRFKVR